MKKSIFLSIILLGLGFSCAGPSAGPQDGETPEVFDPNSFVLYDIADSELKRAERRDSTGTLIESGILKGNVKTGTWVTYHIQTGMPWKQASIVDGVYNGPYFEYTTRGQINLIANYHDNRLHGFWGKYNFGRAEITANYKHGKLDGVYRKYFANKTTIQEEIQYVEGVIDGKYRYYDENGNITVEYDYKNGKKVGGGMVNQ